MIRAVFADDKGNFELEGITAIILDGDCYMVFFNNGTDSRYPGAQLRLIYVDTEGQ